MGPVPATRHSAHHWLGCSTGSGTRGIKLDGFEMGPIPATRTVRIIGWAAVQESGTRGIKLEANLDGSDPLTSHNGSAVFVVVLADDIRNVEVVGSSPITSTE